MSMRSLFSSLHLSLDLFEGPLDVFVHLIQTKEMQSKDFFLNQIFVGLKTQLIDFETASHFLEQVSLLMLFKSRQLLPFEEPAIEENILAPQEAIKHLAEYYQFKELALSLDQRQEEELNRFSRGFEEISSSQPPPGIEQISFEELQSLFQKVLARIPQNPHEITRDSYGMEDGKKLIFEAFNSKDVFDLYELLSEIETRSLLIVTFLALLELMKEGKALIRSDFKVEPS